MDADIRIQQEHVRRFTHAESLIDCPGVADIVRVAHQVDIREFRPHEVGVPSGEALSMTMVLLPGA